MEDSGIAEAESEADGLEAELGDLLALLPFYVGLFGGEFILI